jgi:hypothetical protein
MAPTCGTAAQLSRALLIGVRTINAYAKAGEIKEVGRVRSPSGMRWVPCYDGRDVLRVAGTRAHHRDDAWRRQRAASPVRQGNGLISC